MATTDETIRSRANPLVKRVRAAAAGRADGELLLEGDRLVDDALDAGLELEVVLVAEGRAERLAALRGRRATVRVVAAGVLDGAGTLGHAPGCIALAPVPPAPTVAELDLPPDALLVVAAGIQDPGNLGALARTAEAAGATALLVVRGGCRPWNPRALRGSMGSLLRLPVLEVEPGPELVAALSERGARHVRASTRAGASHATFDWDGRVALWLSGETGELPAPLVAASAAFEVVSIPIARRVESLNVTAAAAVLLFSAGRVRAAE
jgi:TrmH family RNA methyltransferase